MYLRRCKISQLTSRPTFIWLWEYTFFGEFSLRWYLWKWFSVYPPSIISFVQSTWKRELFDCIIIYRVICSKSPAYFHMCGGMTILYDWTPDGTDLFTYLSRHYQPGFVNASCPRLSPYRHLYQTVTNCMFTSLSFACRYAIQWNLSITTT